MGAEENESHVMTLALHLNSPKSKYLTSALCNSESMRVILPMAVLTWLVSAVARTF